MPEARKNRLSGPRDNVSSAAMIGCFVCARKAKLLLGLVMRPAIARVVQHMNP